MQDSLAVAVLKFARQPEFWALGGCILVLCTFISRVLSWHRMRHIPGPWSAGWTDWWLIRRTWRGTLPHDLEEVCRQHGPLARIGPKYVVCSDPRELRRIWGVRSQFNRSSWYKGFRLDPPNDSIVSICDREAHDALRSKLLPGYGGKDVDGVEEAIDAGVARFIRLIEEKYLSTAAVFRPVDFGHKISYMTLDIIGNIAFGERFGFMESDEDLHDYIHTTGAYVPVMSIVALMPWILNLLQSPLCKSLMPTEKDVIGIGPIIALAKSVVAKRYGPKAIHQRDMLGSFVKNGLSQKAAEGESLMQIVAGSDTTAGALRTTMAHIMTNPSICRRLQDEIDSAMLDGRVSSPITDAEAKKLPYLQACIKEGLRIWPPIPALMPRISDSDAVVCGIHIPAGTNVAWSSRTAMRDKTIFGHDPEIYRPDRWILADVNQLQSMEYAIDLCFGQGRTGCLGRPIALMELNKMVVELFRRYDFGIVDVERPLRIKNYSMLIIRDFNVRITRRDAV